MFEAFALSESKRISLMCRFNTQRHKGGRELKLHKADNRSRFRYKLKHKLAGLDGLLPPVLPVTNVLLVAQAA